MPHARRQSEETPGHDSFLDIVANIVGILIILVLLVGVRVKNAPVTLSAASPVDDSAERVAELEERMAVEAALQQEMLAVDAEAERLRRETAAHKQARDVLATIAAAAEEDIRRRRAELDEQAQRDFDLRRRLAESQRKLALVEQQRVQLDASPKSTKVIENRSTPLSRTVEGPEVHFRLSGGRIAVVPLKKLVEKLKAHAKDQSHRLQRDTQVTETIGPLEGFRLRYTLVRSDIGPEQSMELGYGGYVVRLARFDLLPVRPDLGETVDAALQPDSDFRRHLAEHRPDRTTATVWVYPESFGDFRRVRDELYRLGFEVAARPLTESDLIGGSPDGSKSAAQ